MNCTLFAGDLVPAGTTLVAPALDYEHASQQKGIHKHVKEDEDIYMALVEHSLWKEILSQQRIKHCKILQSTYFAYDVGIISSYSNRMFCYWL